MAAEARGCLLPVRPFQHAVLGAVLFLLALPREAETRQISISSSGGVSSSGEVQVSKERLKVANQIIKSAHDRKSRGEQASRRESFLTLDSSKQSKRSILTKRSKSEQSKYNPKKEGIAVLDKSKGYYGQIYNISAPKPPPTEYLLFNWDAGGAWDGERNDMNAEVGFEFTPLKNLNITAMGRHVKGRWDQLETGGKNLFASTNVTLWYVIPRGMKLDKDVDRDVALKLVEIEVGPNSRREAGGTYNFAYLDTPFEITAHEKYRITQTCWTGMDDVWFDQQAKNTDVAQYVLTECISVGDGCHSDYRGGFPNKIEALHRRLGMLNIRVDSKEGCGMFIPESYKDEVAAAAR